MLNINIFNVNVEVGTLTKISESFSGETPRAFDHKVTPSPLNCPCDPNMIFGTTESRKHLLMGPGGLAKRPDVPKQAIAYISSAKREFAPTKSQER